MRRRSRMAGAVGLLMAVGLVLSGCSGSSGSDSSAADAGGAADGGGAPVAGGAAEDSGGADGSAGGSGSDAEARSVIQTGWVSLATTEPVADAEAVIELVAAAGGRVDSRSITTEAEGRHPSASLVVRIPADELDATLAALADIAEVRESQVSADDVTATVVDLDARIRAKQASVERLEVMLEGATTTADIIAAEETLTQRQTELEQLLTEQGALDDQVSYATVTVDLTLPDDVPAEAPPGFTGGVRTGWSSLVSAVTGLLVAVGFLLPWLIPLALVAGLVLVLRRRRRPAPVPEPVASPAPAEQPQPPASDPPASEPR